MTDDEEVFCSLCFAGVESSEHHEKCVRPGFAEDGEPATIRSVTAEAARWKRVAADEAQMHHNSAGIAWDEQQRAENAEAAIERVRATLAYYRRSGNDAPTDAILAALDAHSAASAPTSTPDAPEGTQDVSGAQRGAGLPTAAHAALGLGYGIRQAFGMAATEEQALARLRATYGDPAKVVAAIEQAVLIAQMGGVEDGMLEPLLHLAAARQMTWAVEQALHTVGIDTTPWAEQQARWAHESTVELAADTSRVVEAVERQARELRGAFRVAQAAGQMFGPGPCGDRLSEHGEIGPCVRTDRHHEHDDGHGYRWQRGATR